MAEFSRSFPASTRVVCGVMVKLPLSACNDTGSGMMAILADASLLCAWVSNGLVSRRRKGMTQVNVHFFMFDSLCDDPCLFR